MPRQTDLKPIFFPVTLERIHLKRTSLPIAGFNAIVGKFGKEKKVFSVVSDSYRLVTNKQAFAMGQKLHLRLFPGANATSFELFNVIYPETKSFCYIDIIDKNYKINIWKKEVYLPFVRIQNSYNRARTLNFSVGFCRKLCDNGVIFEKEDVTLRFNHNKASLTEDLISKIDVSHLKTYEADFIKHTKAIADLPLPGKYFLPLSAKVLSQSFDTDSENKKTRKTEEARFSLYCDFINTSTDKYVTEMGENGYAFYNVISDFSSNYTSTKANQINGLQRRCGNWLNNIIVETEAANFSWNDQVANHQQFTNESEGENRGQLQLPF